MKRSVPKPFFCGTRGDGRGGELERRDPLRQLAVNRDAVESTPGGGSLAIHVLVFLLPLPGEPSGEPTNVIVLAFK